MNQETQFTLAFEFTKGMLMATIFCFVLGATHVSNLFFLGMVIALTWAFLGFLIMCYIHYREYK